jgi:hypothetical protein
MSRVGVDVGGTNTDAALLVGNAVVATAKAPSSQDVVAGVVAAVQLLKDTAPSGELAVCSTAPLTTPPAPLSSSNLLEGNINCSLAGCGVPSGCIPAAGNSSNPCHHPAHCKHHSGKHAAVRTLARVQQCMMSMQDHPCALYQAAGLLMAPPLGAVPPRSGECQRHHGRHHPIRQCRD